MREGKLDQAITLSRRALSIAEAALGPDSTELLDDLSTLAQMLHQANRMEEGIAVAKRAIPLVAQASAGGLRKQFLGEMTLGQLFRMLGDNPEMFRHYATALALGDQLPPDDEHLATAWFIIGTTFLDGGEVARASELLERAAASWTRTHSPRAHVANAIRAELLEQQGKCADAIPMFEGAIAGMERSSSDHLNLVRAHVHLAACLVATDRPRALELARGVVKDAGALGEGGTDLANEAKAFLALHDARVAHTGSTHWATSVRAVSSQYGVSSWSAAQALGPPDTYPAYGDARTAWASLAEDGGPETIEVGFAEPVRARAIVVYETFNAGAITTVELVMAGGRRVVYRGAPVATRETRIHSVELPCTPEPVLAVKLVLDSKAVTGWNEIDAIGAVACAP
jgi:tetratricopeptide (TPR) repeat protein